MNRDLASRSFRGRHDFIDDRQEGIGWTSCDQCRLAHGDSGFDKEIECVVVDGQRRNFSTVVPRQIFPVPTRTVLWSNEVALITDDIAVDTLNARGHDARREFVDSFEVVAVVETCGERRITPTVDR